MWVGNQSRFLYALLHRTRAILFTSLPLVNHSGRAVVEAALIIIFVKVL